MSFDWLAGCLTGWIHIYMYYGFVQWILSFLFGFSLFVSDSLKKQSNGKFCCTTINAFWLFHIIYPYHHHYTSIHQHNTTHWNYDYEIIRSFVRDLNSNAFACVRILYFMLNTRACLPDTSYRCSGVVAVAISLNQLTLGYGISYSV